MLPTMGSLFSSSMEVEFVVKAVIVAKVDIVVSVLLPQEGSSEPGNISFQSCFELTHKDFTKHMSIVQGLQR